MQTPLQAGVDSPDEEPYSPAGHKPVHAAVVMPVVFPYNPALQLLHDPAPAKLYVPNAHNTAVADTDPGGQAYPVVQAPLHVAVVCPTEEPYCPAGHKPVHAAEG